MAALDLQSPPSPLHLDPRGVVRVGATRVPLETVLHAYLGGASPETIVARFPTLDLADVHATVAWFLRHREAAEAYLADAADELAASRAEAERRSPPHGLRARLSDRTTG